MSQASLLSIKDLCVHFPLGGKKVVRAVDGVSLEVGHIETLGLVGESGCGKSTLSRAILRLIPATSGSVQFNNQDILNLPEAQMRPLRQRMQMVFQDPYASLSPRRTIEQTLLEPLEIHQIGTSATRQKAVSEIVDQVGMPQTALKRFPHEFSGGQRQRIGIARSLILNPQFLVLDEPVSALDISVRAQIINLLTDLQAQKELSYLFVGHDLALIRRVAHRVAVMYLGKIVEIAPAETLYTNPRHPYTRTLFASAPVPDPTRRRTAVPLEGDPPSPINLPTGCRFHTRCQFATDICHTQEPILESRGAGHFSACHHAQELPVWQEEL
jgi:oligopeptide/dipeptide ABC transporter ATP-binding protein